MVLISLSLALIALALGAFLLSKAKQENLGGFFKFISWFVIIMGFLTVICIGAQGLRHCGGMMGGGKHCEKSRYEGHTATGEKGSCMRGKAECNAEMMMGMESDCCREGGKGKACCKKDADHNMKCTKDSAK